MLNTVETLVEVVKVPEMNFFKSEEGVVHVKDIGVEHD